MKTKSAPVLQGQETGECDSAAGVWMNRSAKQVSCNAPVRYGHDIAGDDEVLGFTKVQHEFHTTKSAPGCEDDFDKDAKHELCNALVGQGLGSGTIEAVPGSIVTVSTLQHSLKMEHEFRKPQAQRGHET